MHTSPRLLLDSLKRCPLCEAVNAEATSSCFVCGWSGQFERDVHGLQASFDDLMDRCPEFAEFRTKRKKAPTWTSRWLRSLQRLIAKARALLPIEPDQRRRG